MVAVEARQVREQSELAETGGSADGFYCSIFLDHLGVSYAQHKVVSRSRKRRTELGGSKWNCWWVGLTLLAGRAYSCACRFLSVSAFNAENDDWSRAIKKRCCLCTLGFGRGSNR